MFSFSPEYYERLQEMVPQRVFRTHFERGNVFEMKAGEPKK